MKTQRLTDVLKSQFLHPSDDFETKLSELYNLNIARYDERIDSINATIFTKVADKLHDFLYLLLTFPATVKENICSLTYVDMRNHCLIKYLNVLTKLYAMKCLQEEDIWRRIETVLQDSSPSLWPALAKSHTNGQPRLFENLLYDGLICITSHRLDIYEYGSLLLCICYYRMFTIEKKYEVGIRAILTAVTVPRGMVTYLASTVPTLSFVEYSDETLAAHVYDICDIYIVMHSLNFRFGNLHLNPVAPLVTPRMSTPQPQNYLPASVSQTAGNAAPQPLNLSLNFRANITNTKKDELITMFRPPTSYRHVKTFVYAYGSRLLQGDEEFARQLHDRINKFSYKPPVTYRSTFVHNFMALYTQIANIVRHSNTVNPILAKVVKITSHTDYRTDILITYMNNEAVCNKIIPGKAIGFYCSGEKKPTFLGFVLDKGLMQRFRKKNSQAISYREANIRCLLPKSAKVQLHDSVGITEQIDLDEQLSELKSLLRRFNNQDGSDVHI